MTVAMRYLKAADNAAGAFCKASREAEQEQAKWDAEIEKAARKYGVTPVYPAAHRKSDPPRDIARWLPTKRMERLYVG